MHSARRIVGVRGRVRVVITACARAPLLLVYMYAVECAECRRRGCWRETTYEIHEIILLCNLSYALLRRVRTRPTHARTHAHTYTRVYNIFRTRPRVCVCVCNLRSRTGTVVDHVVVVTVRRVGGGAGTKSGPRPAMLLRALEHLTSRCRPPARWNGEISARSVAPPPPPLPPAVGKTHVTAVAISPGATAAAPLTRPAASDVRQRFTTLSYNNYCTVYYLLL